MSEWSIYVGMIIYRVIILLIFLILEPPIQKINQGKTSSNEWKLS